MKLQTLSKKLDELGLLNRADNFSPINYLKFIQLRNNYDAICKQQLFVTHKQFNGAIRKLYKQINAEILNMRMEDLKA